MRTVGEICVLVKCSLKREKVLGKLTENVEVTFDPDEQQATKLDKLCVTKWTVHANCLKKIIDNYEPLLKLWKESLQEKLDAETKSRIIGSKTQMESFKFYFGWQLGRKLYAHSDNLSKTLQQEKMSAIKGKSLADLTVQTLEGIRNDRDYNLFYESVEKSAGKIKAVSKSNLPRKRNMPYYSILQFVEGHKSEELHHPKTAHAYFKAIYNEAIDTIIDSNQDKFEQPGFKVFGQVAQLFLKSVNREDHSDEIMTVESTFRGGYDHDSLITELELLPAIFDDCEPVTFGDSS